MNDSVGEGLASRGGQKSADDSEYGVSAHQEYEVDDAVCNAEWPIGSVSGRLNWREKCQKECGSECSGEIDSRRYQDRQHRSHQSEQHNAHGAWLWDAQAAKRKPRGADWCRRANP